MDKVSWRLDNAVITVSLPPTDAEWAAEGTRGLRHVPPTHEGRGPEPLPLPETEGTSPVQLGAMGTGL
ncbi:hypothetical protein [Streptomyces sp. UNOC14_S4]|uniref:hypothetical protein n=1 Tax=Streptomyces sp. UNOC14_S4 TaxID=2872340 RepID=UPI001E2F237C|nr:hypothetical protein [Streptomyces sp. UNOC14_S4]MCC3771422.1 hypothetical protein [Streptomyces sp. UNOC14_S4]